MKLIAARELHLYYIGFFGGRPFIEKYGKWFLISKKDLENADKWAEKWGETAFFICRMLPVIRTFISFTIFFL
jgi:membrane protein DedA with SNARE-associated domain